MRVIRYSKWLGTPVDSLDADRVFDEVNDYLNETGDLQQAVRRMLRRGLRDGEERVGGLDDLLSQVTRERKRLYDQYRLRSALEEAAKRLESIVRQERRALEEQREGRPELREKEKFLDRLPGKLSDAIEKLFSYQFEDAGAEAEFGELAAQLEQIRRLEQYLAREGGLFRGHKSLDLKQAQELMQKMEGLRRLEGQLAGNDLDQVDRELLSSLLGADGEKLFEGVMRMESLLEEAGYVTSEGDRYELTPRAVRKIGQLALRDIYRKLTRDGMGQHAVKTSGFQERVGEETKRYVYGDPLHLSMVETLKNALLREPGVPLKLNPEDFAVYETDYATRAATVLLLDMSWSMSWDGRFAAAKKVALAMGTLIRALYPRDYFAIVGFFTRAVEIKPHDLPQATWNMGDPFTNLQDGLHLAAELLGRRPSRNQQMIVITDGQPTAYYSQGRLYCEWPLSFGGISQKAAQETLKEAERVTRKGITINTFMLDDSPVLRNFIEEMTRINKGRAFYTRPEQLGEYMLVDYIARKRKKV
ncbi:MAG TPA: VWA domain-containing protein [Candidatus Acidoferrales bacterium]|nr:VWA domain-containing protein [Candidatus Acidoferrales bacterium]